VEEDSAPSSFLLEPLFMVVESVVLLLMTTAAAFVLSVAVVAFVSFVVSLLSVGSGVEALSAMMAAFSPSITIPTGEMLSLFAL
jgi:hypothetical protein